MFHYLRVHIFLLLALVASTLFAQESPVVLRRTAEERAMKQTEMLVRDLDIHDSLLRDTIYRVHLRYARRRDQATTRMEAVECINRLLLELKGILSPSQYERLQSIPRRNGARGHRLETDSLAQDATQPTP
ncbi:MAG: hypothetical protein IJT12_05045 [Paludibacteraceae bacterium]|nr:hypothetical protein [Paludibacteraceae bacterium]